MNYQEDSIEQAYYDNVVEPIESEREEKKRESLKANAN